MNTSHLFSPSHQSERPPPSPGALSSKSNEGDSWCDDMPTLPSTSGLAHDLPSDVMQPHELFALPEEDALAPGSYSDPYHLLRDPALQFDYSGLNTPPQGSLLLDPLTPQRDYGDISYLQPPSSGLYPSYEPQSYSPNVRRHSPIFIDTNSSHSPSLLQIPSDNLRTPYDQTSPYGRRPSLTNTSQSSPMLPTTPGISPMVSRRNSPYLALTPVSPASSSLFPSPVKCEPHPRVGQTSAPLHSVMQIAQSTLGPADPPMVPQKTYRPHTQSDRRRYVEDVELEAPIMFYLLSPDECGVPLREALNGRFMRLSGRDDLMFENRGPSVSIRLMWPGYAPWSRQIPTRDFRSPPGPITRSKLAKNVAKTIQRFIEEVQDRPLEEDADTRWRVGARRIIVDDLILVGLQHVSMGSWQAHLRLRRHLSQLS